MVGVERWLHVEINRGHLVWLLPRGWLLFGGVVKGGFTVGHFET